MPPDSNGHRPTPVALPPPPRPVPSAPRRPIPLIDLVLSGALRLGAPEAPAK
jgi:hypothetical protein